ncbi:MULTISPECIES: DNA polymerase III subunit [Caproicibacterium]|uniref:ATP-binding protein n=1 Tax=Caproicibacterium argilliputei TaxID=3030016 RepID=A0AA97D8L3_9FIRM|nr:DNA polymerase III subunit delta' [Caproicibacterium argilliputei]WOC32314.1 ATP-binding protein [Caproicibacterium argilliputei]
MKLDLPETLCPPAVRAALLSVYEQGRIPHALILEGAPEQTLALAKHLAQAAVCTSPEAHPCGHCSGCVKAQAGSHPDITFAGGGETGRSFHKEEILAVRSDTFVRPNEAPCRVFVLENAQNLSPQAQNALLKVLEEPPAAVQFLLTCDRAASLLATVRSRSQIYTLQAVQEEAQDDLARQIALAVCSLRESGLLYLTAPLLKDKLRLRAVLDQLAALFRDALVLRCGGAPAAQNREMAQRLSQVLTRTQLYRLTQAVREMHAYVERNANTALLLTALCARLRQEAGR